MVVDWRRWIRRTLSSLLFHSGLIELLAGKESRRRFILAYHRVLPEGTEDASFVQPGMYVTANTFERQILYLLGHYNVVPLEELLSRPERNACALTFDDGWRDNYTNAFPILRNHRVPATVFLPSSLIGTGRWPWPDRICFYLQRGPLGAFSAAFESAWRGETTQSLRVSWRLADRFGTAEEVLRQLKLLQHDVLERVVARLDGTFANLNSELHSQRPWLTWEEVLEMSQHGISFGSHTENHVILSRVPFSEARAEIHNSRRVISERIGKPVLAFCYPNGDYSPELARFVAEAGYRCAVTTNCGSLDSSPHAFELKRILLHEDISSTIPMFACALAGLCGARPRARFHGRREAPQVETSG